MRRLFVLCGLLALFVVAIAGIAVFAPATANYLGLLGMPVGVVVGLLIREVHSRVARRRSADR